jgi:mannose-1-phosphate guanylyltransferase
MAAHGHTWALVLAAGEGSRLASLTTGLDGRCTPKQFCSLNGGRSLLGDALARAARLVPRERILVVVARQHEALWRHELAGHPAHNVIVQPENRGTAAGILLPLVVLRARDPQAAVYVVPSDHFVANEARLAAAARAALGELRAAGHAVTLLGIEPDAPETGYGWILPGAAAAGAGARAARRVERFVEKPERAAAHLLLDEGALWNSFLLLARVDGVLALAEQRVPGLAFALHAALVAGGDALELLYADLPVHDFSRHLLQDAEDVLRVLPVPHCGWSDLGTPERVLACLDELEARAAMFSPRGCNPLRRAGAARRARPAPRAVLDLTQARDRWRTAMPLAM